MSNTVKNFIMAIVAIICLALIVIGQKTISMVGLGQEIVGLVGLLVILFLYNKRYQ